MGARDQPQSHCVQYRVRQATYSRAWQRAAGDGVSTISALSRALLQAYADGKLKLPAAGPVATKKAVPKAKRAR
jgi:hypothetical protein